MYFQGGTTYTLFGIHQENMFFLLHAFLTFGSFGPKAPQGVTECFVSLLLYFIFFFSFTDVFICLETYLFCLGSHVKMGQHNKEGQAPSSLHLNWNGNTTRRGISPSCCVEMGQHDKEEQAPSSLLPNWNGNTTRRGISLLAM